MALSVLWQR